MTKTAVCDKNCGREIAHEAAPRTLNGREAPFTYPIMDVGGAAFADAFSWCEVCNKHLAMGTCDAGWCAKCYTSAAQGGTMLTLAVHDTTGCECGGRGAQLGSLLPLAGATSSAATLPGAYAQALDAAALPQATRVAFGPCQYLVFAGLSTDGRRQKRRRTARVQSSAPGAAGLVACPRVEPAVVRWAATGPGPVFACSCDRRSLAQFELLTSGGTAEDLEELHNGFESCMHIEHAREALRGTCEAAEVVAFTPGGGTHPVTLAQCGEEHKRFVLLAPHVQGEWPIVLWQNSRGGLSRCRLAIP